MAGTLQEREVALAPERHVGRHRSRHLAMPEPPPPVVVVEDPQQFAVGAGRLPLLVGEVSRQRAFQIKPVAQPFPITPVTSHAKPLAVENRLSCLHLFGRCR